MDWPVSPVWPALSRRGGTTWWKTSATMDETLAQRTEWGCPGYPPTKQSAYYLPSYPENRKQTRAFQPLSFSRRKHGRGQTPAGLPMVERSPFSSGNGRKKPYRTEPNARQLPIRRDLAALSQSTQERNACLYHPLLSVFVESYGERIWWYSHTKLYSVLSPTGGNIR